MENWNRAYVEAPEIFDAFCSAEDPDGRITRSLIGSADLSGREVLEIGCGTGRYAREWAGVAGRYLALERSPGMLRLAQRNSDASCRPEFVCADGTQVPLSDRSVDRVVAGWVVINLRSTSRRDLLLETARVLRPERGAGTWLIENHWSGEFQELRGRRGEVERSRVEALCNEHGFAVVDMVRTELRFPSDEMATHVLGWLCGEDVRSRLRKRPTSRLSHHVVILHRPALR